MRFGLFGYWPAFRQPSPRHNGASSLSQSLWVPWLLGQAVRRSRFGPHLERSVCKSPPGVDCTVADGPCLLELPVSGPCFIPGPDSPGAGPVRSKRAPAWSPAPSYNTIFDDRLSEELRARVVSEPVGPPVSLRAHDGCRVGDGQRLVGQPAHAGDAHSLCTMCMQGQDTWPGHRGLG